MKKENEVAYKEWAAVTEALAQGLHLMSLRKGGIHEKQGEFQVEHREFWLFPTYLHQKAEDLAPALRTCLETAQAQAPREGQVRISHYVSVQEAVYLESLEAALALEGWHPFSRAAVEARFQYRKPGIWALVQRVFVRPEALLIEDERVYAGCRSWVHLQQPIATDGLRPVLSDAVFQQRLQALRPLLGAGR